MPSARPVIREIHVKGALTPSRSPGIDYSLNPYLGCAFGCSYCYADFMRKYSGHAEPWGGFVDAKANVADCLARELRRKRPGHVSLSLVTDPYQPAERRFGLTRRCLELLRTAPAFTVSILTRSPLVVRDLELFRTMPAIEVGLTIATDDDAGAPGWSRALSHPLWCGGVAPAPGGWRADVCVHRPAAAHGPGAAGRVLAGAADYVYIDRMNYPWKIRALYREHGWDEFLEPAGSGTPPACWPADWRKPAPRSAAMDGGDLKAWRDPICYWRMIISYWLYPTEAVNLAGAVSPVLRRTSLLPSPPVLRTGQNQG
jgi:hypothetical protein